MRNILGKRLSNTILEDWSYSKTRDFLLNFIAEVGKKKFKFYFEELLSRQEKEKRTHPLSPYLISEFAFQELFLLSIYEMIGQNTFWEIYTLVPVSNSY